MLNILSEALKQIIDNIESGNSKLSEEEQQKVLKSLRFFTDSKAKLSKYQACSYLNISRSTFDNYVKDGKLPQGQKQQGFKELFWVKEDLDNYIKSNK